MDEILIEEKRYVSSKRAAKATGYAKDYIGQLCREGRVPARLVGRSWYVLESAIHDHRFGEPVTPAVEPASSQPTWESPRYEPSEVEVLPSVNRLLHRDVLKEAVNEEVGSTDDADKELLQETWQAWFDRIGPVISSEKSPSPEPEKVPEPEKFPEEEPEAPETEENREVSVPIRSVYQPLSVNVIPDLAAAETLTPDRRKPLHRIERNRSRVPVSMQLAGAFVALVLAVLAVAGTGYFDEYLISSKQESIVAGVSFYNK